MHSRDSQNLRFFNLFRVFGYFWMFLQAELVVAEFVEQYVGHLLQLWDAITVFCLIFLEYFTYFLFGYY